MKQAQRSLDGTGATRDIHNPRQWPNLLEVGDTEGAFTEGWQSNPSENSTEVCQHQVRCKSEGPGEWFPEAHSTVKGQRWNLQR